MNIRTTNALLWALSAPATLLAAIYAEAGWLAVALLFFSMTITLAFEAMHTKWKTWAMASNITKEPASEPIFMKSVMAEATTIAAIFYGVGIPVTLAVRFIFWLGQLSDIGRFGKQSNPFQDQDGHS